MARKQDLTKIQIQYDKANAKYTRAAAGYQEDPGDPKLEARYRKAKNDLAVARRTYKIHRDQILGLPSDGDAVAQAETVAVRPSVPKQGETK